MKVVIQRVSEAKVEVSGIVVSQIGNGMMILVGVSVNDTYKDADWIIRKVSGLRIFNDEEGIMNKSVTDVSGEILAVSQFTLLADVVKGNRPSYAGAAKREKAEALYDYFCSRLESLSGINVKKGVFGADMQVSLTNDGPVTIIMENPQK